MPGATDNTQENFSNGGSTYIVSQGRWIENRESAKRNAIREAQRTFAEQQNSIIRGHSSDLEDHNGNRKVENFNHSQVNPVSVKVTDVQIVEEETRHDNSWMWNQQWRFKVRVEIPNSTNDVHRPKVIRINQKTNYSGSVEPDGKYYSIPKSEIHTRTNISDTSNSSDEKFLNLDDLDSQFSNFKDQPAQSPPMTSEDKFRYTMYAVVIGGTAYVIANPWLLWFL